MSRLAALIGSRRPSPVRSTSHVWKMRFMPDERRVGTKRVLFAPPDRDTDWVLLLRVRER